MKRITILLVLFGLMSASAMAFDAIGEGGVGWIMQKGQPTAPAFFGGFTANIVTKPEVGYTLQSVTDYVYSDRVGGEIQSARELMVNKRSIIQNPKLIWSVSLGAGAWTFMNTNSGDQIYGVLQFATGLKWKFVDLTAAIEVIPVPNVADMYMPSISIDLNL